MANLDTFIGGAGDDSYFVDDSADAIIENPDAGTDIVQAEVSYILPANVDNLSLLNVGNINATGNALNNVLMGNDYANRLNGLSGQDTLIGGFGDDAYVIDDVGDVIVENLEEGIDTVETNLNYTLIANLENLILTGTANLNGTGNELNNTLNGNSGSNTLAGGDSGDILVGEAGTDNLLGEQGNDQLYGGLDEDALDAGTGADYLEGNEGDDRLYAAVTNVNINTNSSQTTYQIITSDLEADTFRGGIGSDIIIAGNSNDDIDGGTGANVVYANGGNDTIRGGISNYVDAGDGDDDVRTGGSAIISGGAGNDYLEAADNLNNISGGDGNDWIVGSGVLTGGTGDDLFGVDLIPPTLYGSYEVTDFVAGGAEDSMDNYHLLQDLRARGFDASNIGEWLRLVQDGADTKLQVDKSGARDGVGFQDIAVFKNTNLSQFNGSDFSHYITLGGDRAANINQTVDASLLDRTGTYMGKDGNDTLVGLTAPNQIDGGLGDDVIMGQDSSDVLFGDFGNDELHGNGGNDNILGGTGNDSIFGGTGDDGYFYDVNYKRVVFAGGLRGEEGDDYLDGGDGQDYLDGGSGNDSLHGGADNDSLYGRTGSDQLYGEAGDDSLSSDDGNDYLSGGAGEDTLQAYGDNSLLL
ncbi:MAG: calcium-binding protein, partial [Agitococcus sp.]|nr:calcium-binding protein [Agitococcus sp.]